MSTYSFRFNPSAYTLLESILFEKKTIYVYLFIYEYIYEHILNFYYYSFIFFFNDMDFLFGGRGFEKIAERKKFEKEVLKIIFIYISI